MAVIKSGASADQLTIDSISKGARAVLYNALGEEVALNSRATFAVSATFTPAANPSDLIAIYGSASKFVRVLKFEIVTTNTAAGSQQFLLIRRNAVNTGGNFVAQTPVTMDSSDGIAATASVGHYTTNPSALGTSAGTIAIKRIASPAAVPASFAGVMEDASCDFAKDFLYNNLSKPIGLSSNTQGLVLNFAGAAIVAGQTHAYTIIWTEE